jgi:hypothetical protein
MGTKPDKTRQAKAISPPYSAFRPQPDKKRSEATDFITTAFYIGLVQGSNHTSAIFYAFKPGIAAK